MGLLSKGTPLPWKEVKKDSEYIRKHGIIQFLNIYNKVKGRTKDKMFWGDEVEYMLVKFDHEKKKATLDLRAVDVLSKLQKDEEDALKNGVQFETSWKPEYAGYMLEATPGLPYGYTVADLVNVERNMNLRRATALKYLNEDEALMTITSFPMLGMGDFLSPETYARDGKYSHSIFIPDQIISPHARFPTLTANIRERRGRKVDINIPVFKDKNTPQPYIEEFPPAFYPEDGAQDALPDHIYMDCMCFGMGNSCLQVTFQACNVCEARHLYDQFVVLSPIMLCLTAAAPLFRGHLADTDCRWNVIAKSVDDRTNEEQGKKPLKNDKYVIKKSRYDSVDCYICVDDNCEKYNDIEYAYCKEGYEMLVNNGVDSVLAKHISHLFIRDPLVVYRELLHQDDTVSSDHFENIQSTNWQTARFKPPPPNSNIGWRVEFRSMEIQFTDFENAAFCVFIVLATKAIVSFKLNFYIPMSKNEENMQVAQRRDAVLKEKFYFRNYVFDDTGKPCSCDTPPASPLASPHDARMSRDSEQEFGSADARHVSYANKMREILKSDNNESFEKKSINEIINGKKLNGTSVSTPGLADIIDAYLDNMNLEPELKLKLSSYIGFVRKRASGELITPAAWIRKFVRGHPEYKFDSKINEQINYDLLWEISKIAKGKHYPEELYGDFMKAGRNQ